MGASSVISNSTAIITYNYTIDNICIFHNPILLSKKFTK